jgi:hypothetical protein
VIALTLTSCTEDAAGPAGAGGSATPQLAKQDGSTGSAEEGTISPAPVEKMADPGVDVDAIDCLFGFGDGIGTWNLGPVVQTDIVHGGWLPAAFFDALAEDGSEFILAVTFTFGFTDADGNFVDQDGDGKLDAAFREIFYNDTFEWGIDVSTDPFDVETVALHEAGHGLSQGHFGKIFVTDANDKLHFAPFAVMNAAISRQAQELEGTDNGGHCSIWAHWPN